jgi:hypothetical protein
MTLEPDFDRETSRVCGCGQPLTHWVIVGRVRLWFWCLRCDAKMPA